MDRRRFIGLLASASFGTLAGCPRPPNSPKNNTTNQSFKNSSEFSGDLTGVVPESTPPSIPTNTHCSNKGKSMHYAFVDFGKVKQGDFESWELRISETNISIGDSFSIEIQNTSSNTLEFGNRFKYNLQLYTENGWQEIRWLEKSISYEDVTVSVEPDDGIRWNFYATPNGIIAPHPKSDIMSICPELPPGRYRFICGYVPVSVQFNIE